jgi:3-deoxy-manno-octulosonate cytidylyltransferase (CMP-KDO synthetase)
LASNRLPNKILADLGGESMLKRVYLAAKSCPQFEKVIIAVDEKKVFEYVLGFTKDVYLTSKDCRSGTERLLEIHQRKIIDADIWVNWQADEPFIHQELIDDLLQNIDSKADIWTLRKSIDQEENPADPNIVKVVSGVDHRALYFSRAAIPYQKNTNGILYKHIGIYAFTKASLEKIATLSPSPLEAAENLEQLRFLYHGLMIKVNLTEYSTHGIDTMEDLQKARIYIAQKAKDLVHNVAKD